jgi:ATP-binding cassette, subfamily B, bacterial MsbA
VRLFLRFLSFLKPYRAQLFLALVLVFASTGMIYASARVFKHIFSEFDQWKDFTAVHKDMSVRAVQAHARVLNTLANGTIVIIICLLASALSAWRAMVAGTVSQLVVFDIRNRVMEHLTRLSLRFYETHPTGQLMSRITADVDAMQLLVTSSTVDLPADVVQAVVLGGVLFWISPNLAIVALVMIPMLSLGTAFFGRRMRSVSRAVQAQLGAVSAQMLETISGIRVVMGFSAEKREQERFRAQNATALKLGLQRLRLQTLWSVSAESSVQIAMVILAVAGLREIVKGRLEIENIGMFTYLLMFMRSPLQRLFIFNDTLQRGLAGTERVFEVLDTPPDVHSLPGAVDAPRPRGSISFDSVSFAYDHGQPVLHDVSLEVPPGSTVALVGPSGAGKSTMANLIVRFYDPSEGAVRVDGTDIRGWTLESWRRHIGLVLQDTFLFSGTARDNIAIGREGATNEEIEAAAIAANIHDYLMGLPKGYETEVGERGVKLSGGQRQRIAIARAILRDPPILVLDEATSSLDSESERLIQSALDRLLEHRTAFVIAHRLSTIQRADTIIVIDGGRIVEQGEHSQLMANNGLYARLYHTQFQAPPARRPYSEPGFSDL